MTNDQIVQKALEAARATLARRNPGHWIPPVSELEVAIGAYVLTCRQLARGEQDAA